MDNTIFQNYINSLRFFTGNGKEILMRKQNSVSWEIIPNDLVYPAFLKNPKGHLEASLEDDMTSEFVEQQSGDYMTSDLEGDTQTLYTYTFNNSKNKEIMYIKRGQRTIKKVIATTDETVEVKFVLNRFTNEIDIIEKENIIIKNTHSIITNGNKFVCLAFRDSEFSLSRKSLKATVVVDEPGIIQPEVKFYRKDCDADFVRSYELMESTDNICNNNPYHGWKEIADESLTYYIDNVYDIIFFGYKTISDNEEYIMSNTLRLTVNDGENIITEDYYLEDFFVGTTETCIKENLVINHIYNPDSDEGFFIESADEILRHRLSTKSEVYGITDKLIAQCVMTYYEQWDKELLNALADFIEDVHNDQDKYSDKEILTTVLSILKKYDVVAEYWDSSSVISIVRDLDEDGESSDWEYPERKTEIAKELLDFLVYSTDADILKLETVPYYVLTYNIPETQYPYVRYVGDVIQDIVSSTFIEPQTIVVVCEDENGNYIYPQITDGNTEYRIHFRFQENSEMFFIQMKDSVEMIRQNALFALLPSEINITDNPRLTNALHFTTGFQAEREGCYQNTMGIFLRNMQTEEDFFVGAIMFKTQVEAEDERYRTLLENFGVPDPKTYPNIFREQDPDEQGIDWKLINKKSKELMLSYDDIFPYSGTYRSLFRAIKFLGYDDIVFKEWYKIIDNTETQRYVAIQNFDVSTGKSIRNVLKSYGVEYSQYQRYSKLNRLSMIYHLQEISSGEFEDRLKMYAYRFRISPGLNVYLPSENEYLNVLDFAEAPNSFGPSWKNVKVKIVKKPSFNYICNENGEYLSKTSTAMTPVWTSSTASGLLATYTTFTQKVPFDIEDEGGRRYSWLFPDDEIPLIKNIYEFRNDEILAKLYQVKLWIERYITGVGCYISDINGESIILERIKTQAWMTDTVVNDMTTAGRFTPRAEIKTHPVVLEDGSVRHEDDDFTDSSINIRCTLNEFRSLTIDDYSDFPIERFIRWQYDRYGNPGPMTLDVSVDGQTIREDIYPSPTLDSLTVADEYEYTLRLNDASSGSLYEFADASCLDNPIIVSDGEITLFDDSKHTSTITNSKKDEGASNECPIIEITKGNVREVYGDWSPDSEDNNIAFSILSYLDDDGNYYVKMTSQSDGEKFLFKGGVLLTPEKNNARFEYTDQNQWSLPMIVVKGYYPSNQMYSDYMNDSSRRVALPENGYFPREKTFVIEILEGSIHFRNHRQPVEQKECRSADIIFSETATQGMGEQDIRINYSYSSDRLHIAEFPTKEEAEEVLSGKKFDDFQQMYDFIDSLVVKNTEVDIPVNRIGTYTVSVKAYDAYNNTFASTSDDFIEVKAASPSIDIIVNQGKSDNSIEFYKENITSDSPLVAKLTNTEKREVNSKMDATPLFPKTYKIYSASHDTEEDEIVYDNISYAIDTPKKDERIILTNMTEQVYDVLTEDNTLKFRMKNGNPEKQNIFNLGGTVSICAWSENMKSVLGVVKDVKVISCEAPNYYRSDLIYPDGYIIVDKDTIMSSEISEYIENLSDDVTLYIIDTTEVDITDKCEDIISGEIKDASTGVVTRLSFIPVDREDADNFKPDTMIKMRVEYVDPLLNDSKMLVNESAYRILKITDEIREALEVNYGEYGYVINGHIDICNVKKFHSRDIFDKTVENDETHRKRYLPPVLKTTMRPLHDEPVEYELIVTEDAVESMYVYQDYKFYGQKTTVKYDDGQLMFGAYMDDQYAALPMKYDPLDLFEIWSPKEMEREVDYYRYRDFPITVDAGRYVIMKGQKTVPQLKDGWKTLWKWQTYAIRDLENLRENNQDDLRRMLLFESNSEILTVRPQMLGSQSVELYLTDLYGNVISNTGGGNLYVRDTVEEDVENVLKRNISI